MPRISVDYAEGLPPPLEDKRTHKEWLKTRIETIQLERRVYNHAMVKYKLSVLHKAHKRWKEQAGLRFKPGDKVKERMPQSSAKGQPQCSHICRGGSDRAARTRWMRTSLGRWREYYTHGHGAYVSLIEDGSPRS